MADEERTEELGKVPESSVPTPETTQTVPAASVPAEPTAPRQSLGQRFRSSLAAQIVSAVLAVLVIGGIGFGIGYAVGDSGHGGHHRHGGHHMMMRDGGGMPGGRGPGMNGFDGGGMGNGGMPGGGMRHHPRTDGNAPAAPPAPPAAPNDGNPAPAPAPAPAPGA